MGKPLNNPARLDRAALKTATDGCKPILERLSKGKSPTRATETAKAGKGYTMRKTTKYTIEQGWQGCIIRKEIRGRKFPLWLGGVYRGRATWYCDYTPARIYTPKGAAAIVAKLERGEIE